MLGNLSVNKSAVVELNNVIYFTVVLLSNLKFTTVVL